MTYLLDTCIISKLRKIKTHPDKILEKWFTSHEEHSFFLSVLTIGEIHQGIQKKEESHGKRVLEEWLYGELVPRFKDRILPIDQTVGLKWGELSGSYQRRGMVLPVIDSMIAATAIVHDFIVVTENVSDFRKIVEAKVFNPWEVF